MLKIDDAIPGLASSSAAIASQRSSPAMVRAVRSISAPVERALARPALWLTCIIVLLTLQTVLVVIHRSWLDEWQALLIASLSPDQPALFANLRYEGHPPLWYWLLQGVGTLVPPFAVLGATQLVIALTTQLLLLTRLTLPRADRLLFSASYFVLIEIGTVSRSLSLGTLLFICAFALRSKALRWLPIALLPLVDFQFGLLSLIVMALLWKGSQWSWSGAFAWLTCSLFSAWSIIPAPDMFPAIENKSWPISALISLGNLSALLVPVHLMEGRFNWQAALPVPLSLIVGCLFLLFADRILRASPLHRALFWAFVGANLFFSIFIYPLGVRHLTLIALLLAMLMAVDHDQGLSTPPAFRIWLAGAALAGLVGAVVSLERPFDTGYRAAAYIRSHALQDKLWAGWPDTPSVGASAMLGREIFHLGKGCRQSFYRWNYRDDVEQPSDLLALLRRTSARHGRFYLVTTVNMNKVAVLAPRDYIRPLAEFPGAYNGFVHRLYLIGPKLPESGAPVPACAAERLPINKWANR